MKLACNTLLLLCLMCLLASAQDFRAQVSGQVTDKTGAAIPGAKVTASRKSTNQTTSQVTNQEGFYTLTALIPDDYTIEVEASGFKREKKTDLTLLDSDKVILPFQLEVGEMNQEVTVSASTEILATGDASGGVNFDSKLTSELPLNGRQVYMLMMLSPGVQFTQEQFGASGYSGTRGWDVSGAYVMNGGVSGSNSFSLNGAPNSITGTWQTAPNVDAIQEFKIQTNTYDASMGRTGGGSVNVMIKSGSNNWHGTLFDFMRNSILDANYTQNNQVLPNGAPRGKHITHQFGGTLGGALRKDRDFVFFSFEGFHEIVPFPVTATVPPKDIYDGQHFSEYKITVYDPATGHVCVSKVDVSGTCSSTYIRNPFPGDTIPQSRMSPIAQKILSYYPAPNIASPPGTFAQTFDYANSTGRYHYYQPMFRWDRQIDANDRFYTLFTFQHGQEYRNQTGIPGAAAAGNINTQRQPINIIAAWTRILSPTTILDVRASFGRFTSYFPDTDLNIGVTATQLGMTSFTHAPTSTLDAPPRIILDGGFANLFGNGANLYTWSTDNQWNIAPTVTMTRGAMTLKFGLDLIYAMQGSGNIGQANGQLTFTGFGTQQYPLAGSTTTNNGLADLMLGIPGSTSGANSGTPLSFVDWNDTYYRTWPYFGIFAQNDWRIAHNLTLNLGLRYDVQIPWVERWNRVNNGFDFSAVNPDSAAILAAWAQKKGAYTSTTVPYPAPPADIFGGKTFVQPNGNRRTYNTDWEDIQPRIGIAWNFMSKTVLRTGFGIYHATATNANYTDGFSQQTPYIDSLDGGMTPSALSATGPYSLQNPFPNGLIAPTGRSVGLLTNIGNSVSFDGSQRPIPRTFQYSFGLQRQLPYSVILDASYVGSKTTHVGEAYNMDYLPMSVFLAGQAKSSILDTTVPNPFYGILPTNTTLGASANIAAKYLYYPYPEFTGITMSTNPWGWYRYDGLQLRVQKHFTGDRYKTGGLTTIFSYTFSKNFQDTTRLNNWDLSETPVHELVSYDKPQYVAFSGVWSLPFGRGRAFASTANAWVNGVIGGWTMNYIFTFNSGIPVAGINTLFLCDTYLTTDQSHDHWFNNTKSCYKGFPNSYYLRTMPDRFPWLRQMDNTTMNLSITKDFSITERWTLNLRGEAFNLMNHPLYGAPDTTYTDARFGMLPLGQQNFPRLVQVSAKLRF
jgi:hypothetical protein